jgi:MFS family permease
MITWGIFAAALSLAQGVIGLLVFRFLLGVAESGFVAGIFLFLTYWFPSKQRGKALSSFLLAVPISQVVGSPISGLILARMNGLLGLDGWRWLFIIEGAPAILGSP